MSSLSNAACVIRDIFPHHHFHHPPFNLFILLHSQNQLSNLPPLSSNPHRHPTPTTIQPPPSSNLHHHPTPTIIQPPPPSNHHHHPTSTIQPPPPSNHHHHPTSTIQPPPPSNHHHHPTSTIKPPPPSNRHHHPTSTIQPPPPSSNPHHPNPHHLTPFNHHPIIPLSNPLIHSPPPIHHSCYKNTRDSRRR